MVRDINGKELALLRGHRYDVTQPAPEYECLSCHLKGHCRASEMCREVTAFGILIKQTRQIIQCSHCSNEVVVGSMDLPTCKNMEPNLGNFNLRNLSEDERAALRAVIGRRVRLHYSDAAEDQNASVHEVIDKAQSYPDDWTGAELLG